MANIEMKCPCCDGALTFDNLSQKVVCPYCDSEFAASDLQSYSEDLEKTGNEDTAWSAEDVENYSDVDAKGMKVYTCNSCGGEIICEEQTSSTSCPYCGNNVLISKELAGDLKPNYIILFNKDKEYTKEALKKHFKKKPLLPSSFSKENTIEEIKSLYVPFWIFNADVDGKVRFKAEKHRTWSDSNYSYKETKYYSVVRGGHAAFDHVPVDGSKKMQDELMESIEPYDFNEAKAFEPAMLSGWAADRYDVSKDETFKRASQRFAEGTAEQFRKDIHGYDEVSYKDSNLNLSNTKASYALYPVWILNTKWHEKNFRFAVNGQTGKIAGNLPISKFKAAMFSLMFFLLIGGVFEFLGFLINNWEFEGGLLILAIVLGALFTAGIMWFWVKRNKNVAFQYGAAPYLRDNSVRIDMRKDIYLYSKVSKTRKSSSSSSSSHKKR